MKNNFTYDYIIVGGGIVGLSIAYKLQKKYPNLTICLLEKEKKLSFHQSGRNSGVIHSGLYYEPNSLRAKNCVNGRKQLVEFAKFHNLNFEITGKIVVATNQDELSRVKGIYERGKLNGLNGIRIIDSHEIKEIEPHIQGIKGIWVPQSGIIDYSEVCNKFAELVRKINPKSSIITNSEVISFTKGIDNKIHTKNKSYLSKNLIFCGGLFSDRLATMDKVNKNMRIVGFRGDYFKLNDSAKNKIRNLVYPIPNPKFPFLGVHFTRMVDGSVECGPNAVFTFKREGYGKLDFNFKDTYDALSYQGTWKLFFKNWKFGLNEYRRAFSKKLFLKELKKLCPKLKISDLSPGRSGVRAISLLPNGEVFDDFKIIKNNRSIHILNAPSPAATSCLSIADHVINLIEN